jgi:hypothetical protein
MNFPTIEFKGYDQKQTQANLSHIFNEDQLEEMANHVGQSIYFTRLFTEVCK